MDLSRIRGKLRSQSGATIIYALFFFIICAVIGSVVLTAGTAAAGRLSQAIAMDERYYAVNSAAELLEAELSGGDVWVKLYDRKTRTDTITSTLTKQDGEWTEGTRSRSKGTATPVAVDPDAGSAPVCALLSDAAALDASSQSNPLKVKLSHGGSGDSLNANLELTADNAHNLTILLYDDGARAQERYYLTLNCPAHVQQKKTVQEKTLSVEVENSGASRQRTERREVITTVTTTLKWSVAATMKGKGA